MAVRTKINFIGSGVTVTDDSANDRINVNIPGSGSASDASTTVKGVTKLATAPASSTDPIAVGTNDARVTADQAAGTASIRTLGTGATQAAAGNHTHSALTADQAAGTASIRTLGTGATQAAAGNHTHSGLTADQAAGTASVRTLGTGSLQAAAGDHTHLAADITDLAVVTINTQTASYTLVSADAGKLVQMNVGSANNLTVPADATTISVGSIIIVAQIGAGQTTLVAAGGVTINSRNGLKLAGQHAEATLTKIAANTWRLSGDTTT